MMFVFLFLTNFTSMIISSCICAVANGIILFLLKAEWCSIYIWVCVYTHTHHSFFIHSSIGEYLDYFHTLATVNSAAFNIGVHV